MPKGQYEPKRGPTLPNRFTPRFLSEADQRVGNIKRARELVERFKQDTGCDSTQKEVLCFMAAFFATLVETRCTEALEGGELDAGSLTQTANALLGVLKALGLEKKYKAKRLDDHWQKPKVRA